jgi:hypothetical protein
MRTRSLNTSRMADRAIGTFHFVSASRIRYHVVFFRLWLRRCCFRRPCFGRWYFRRCRFRRPCFRRPCFGRWCLRDGWRRGRRSVRFISFRRPQGERDEDFVTACAGDRTTVDLAPDRVPSVRFASVDFKGRGPVGQKLLHERFERIERQFARSVWIRRDVLITVL